MNELLKELLPNPYTVDYQVPHDGRGFDLYDEKKMIEYGQRIVKECLTAIDKTDTTHIYTTFDQSMVMGTIEKSKKAVKEHFGM